MKSYRAKKPIKAEKKNTKNWLNTILKAKLSHAHKMSEKAIQRKKSKETEREKRKNKFRM